MTVLSSSPAYAIHHQLLMCTGCHQLAVLMCHHQLRCQHISYGLATLEEVEAAGTAA
jgi:hypothetical protein